MSDGQHSLSGLRPQGLDALHAGVYGLDEASLLKRNSFPNADGTIAHNPVHDADILRKAAAGGFKSRRATYLLIRRTLREGLVTAVIAFPAGDVVEDDDAVSFAEIADALANGGDHARGFVAEDAWRGVRTGRNLLEVSAANAAAVHAD